MVTYKKTTNLPVCVCLVLFFYATVYKATCALRQIAAHGVAPRNVTLAVRYLRKHADGHTCELIAVCHFGHVKLASPASQSASDSVKWQSLSPPAEPLPLGSRPGGCRWRLRSAGDRQAKWEDGVCARIKRVAGETVFSGAETGFRGTCCTAAG